MIAPRKPVCRQASPPDWHRQFLAMLPVIRDYADHAFRHLAPEGREDAVHEVVANAVVAFARLVELGKPHLASPTVLARYGVAQLREGRRVGNRLRIGEVLSEYAQRKKGFAVERLDCFDERRPEAIRPSKWKWGRNCWSQVCRTSVKPTLPPNSQRPNSSSVWAVPSNSRPSSTRWLRGL